MSYSDESREERDSISEEEKQLDSEEGDSDSESEEDEDDPAETDADDADDVPVGVIAELLLVRARAGQHPAHGAGAPDDRGQRVQGKLGNETFLGKAPPEVVAGVLADECRGVLQRRRRD